MCFAEVRRKSDLHRGSRCCFFLFFSSSNSFELTSVLLLSSGRFTLAKANWPGVRDFTRDAFRGFYYINIVCFYILPPPYGPHSTSADGVFEMITTIKNIFFFVYSLRISFIKSNITLRHDIVPTGPRNIISGRPLLTRNE